MLELRILNGLHRGARALLSPGTFTVGSSEGASFVLLDPGIETMHLTLAVEGSTHVEIKSLSGEVLSADGQSLANSTLVEPGMMLCLRGVWLAIDHPTAPWANAPLDYAAALNRHFEALRAEREFLSETENADEYLKPVPVQTQRRAAFAAAAGVAVCALIGVFTAVVALPSKNSDASNAAMRVKGAPTLKKVPDEPGVQSEEVKSHPSQLTGTPVSQNITTELPFQIQAVAAGPQGWVVTSEGERIYVGGVSHGFKLVAIEPSTLRFSGPVDITVNW